MVAFPCDLRRQILGWVEGEALDLRGEIAEDLAKFRLAAPVRRHGSQPLFEPAGRGMGQEREPVPLGEPICQVLGHLLRFAQPVRGGECRIDEKHHVAVRGPRAVRAVPLLAAGGCRAVEGVDEHPLAVDPQLHLVGPQVPDRLARRVHCVERDDLDLHVDRLTTTRRRNRRTGCKARDGEQTEDQQPGQHLHATFRHRNPPHDSLPWKSAKTVPGAIHSGTGCRPSCVESTGVRQGGLRADGRLAVKC